MASGPTSVMIQGKEIELFNETQLSALKREALIQRGMSLRDAIGADQLPTMPRQPEALVSWIMDVQAGLTQGGPLQAGGGPPQDQIPGGRGEIPSGRGSSAGSGVPMSEGQQAYQEAKRASQAARDRNQGGGMAGIFGGN